MKTQRSYTYLETVGDITQDRPVLKFHTEDSLSEVLSRMKASNETAAGVVDVSSRLVGMLTQNNIMRRVLPRLKNWPANFENLSRLRAVENVIASDVMIEQPDCLHIDDRVEDAVDVMTYLSHQYMPVTDSEKRLVGIVGFDELRSFLERKYGVLKSLDDPVSLYMIQQKLGDLNLGYAHTLEFLQG